MPHQETCWVILWTNYSLMEVCLRLSTKEIFQLIQRRNTCYKETVDRFLKANKNWLTNKSDLIWKTNREAFFQIICFIKKSIKTPKTNWLSHWIIWNQQIKLKLRKSLRKLYLKWPMLIDLWIKRKLLSICSSCIGKISSCRRKFLRS